MSYILKAYGPNTVVGSQNCSEGCGAQQILFSELDKTIQDELTNAEKAKYTLDFIKSLLTADDDRSDEQIFSDIEMIVLTGRYPT